jgi:hypothetical protein
MYSTITCSSPFPWCNPTDNPQSQRAKDVREAAFPAASRAVDVTATRRGATWRPRRSREPLMASGCVLAGGDASDAFEVAVQVSLVVETTLDRRSGR